MPNESIPMKILSTHGVNSTKEFGEIDQITLSEVMQHISDVNKERELLISCDAPDKKTAKELKKSFS